MSSSSSRLRGSRTGCRRTRWAPTRSATRSRCAWRGPPAARCTAPCCRRRSSPRRRAACTCRSTCLTLGFARSTRSRRSSSSRTSSRTTSATCSSRWLARCCSDPRPTRSPAARRRKAAPRLRATSRKRRIRARTCSRRSRCSPTSPTATWSCPRWRGTPTASATSSTTTASIRTRRRGAHFARRAGSASRRCSCTSTMWSKVVGRSFGASIWRSGRARAAPCSSSPAS
mmetsp:Transcript_31199/g.68260  ORF Transcript_31199/g.68260 Transcript_31199/m.68260 type:complete len:229 (-) Transcript_31199:606-1292(-)